MSARSKTETGRHRLFAPAPTLMRTAGEWMMSFAVVSYLDGCAPLDAGMSDERADICGGARTSTQDPANENGGARSFEQVILPHLDAAYNLARWLTRDPALAEDVVQ